MLSQWRPTFNKAQATLGMMRLVWRKERSSLFAAMAATLLLIAEPIPHQWSLIALVWLGTLFRFIEAWPSWNSVKISRWIYRFFVGVCMYDIWLLSDPNAFLHWARSLYAALGTR